MGNVTGILICQAGCILKNLHDHVNMYGFSMPIDLAARGRSVCYCISFRVIIDVIFASYKLVVDRSAKRQ